METIEKTELSILNEISRISNVYLDLPRKLQRIIEAIVQGMGKDGASVFLLDTHGKNVTMTAAVGLKQEAVGTLTFPLGTGIAGWVAEQKVPLALEDPFADPRFQYVPETGIERFKSLVAAPIMDEDRCLGVLFVLSTPAWNAQTSDITLVTTVANQISGVIKSSLLLQDLQQRLADLATIYEIGMALTSTLELDQLVRMVAGNSMHALRAQGCTIRFPRDSSATAPEAGVYHQVSDEAVRDLLLTSGGIVADRAAAERRQILIKRTAQEPSLASLPAAPAGSIMSAPLIYRDRVIGVITLCNTEAGWHFAEDDLQLLTTIASTAAVALENAAMYERMEALASEARMRAQELSILYDIGTAMSTTLNLDRLLRIILTAATMGGSGLGFNRALLLLTNERTRTLQGMMGVGPATWEEAGRAWSEVVRKHRSLMEWIQTGELFEHRDTAINAIARGIRVSLDQARGVLALTVREKKPFNIVDAATNPIVDRELLAILGVNSFATVPLVAKDKAIGVILVDNMFTQRPITDQDIRFLTLFAQQAALAIDNAIIHSNDETLNKDLRVMHEQLVQSEKMAALGAMMAEITHEIRNPLVSIGGFTRRLAKKSTDESTHKYADIIMSEVARLEGIIQDNLAYIKETVPQQSEQDLNGILLDIIVLNEDELRQRGIRLAKDLAPSLPAVMIDPQQMKQALINIITNALEAMDRGGVLTIKTLAAPDAAEAAVEVGDTGHGISPEAMPNLFNPYYTTKIRGTGLGLSITHRIIKAHKGKILYRNKETGGAVFTILLPVKGAAERRGESR